MDNLLCRVGNGGHRAVEASARFDARRVIHGTRFRQAPSVPFPAHFLRRAGVGLFYRKHSPTPEQEGHSVPSSLVTKHDSQGCPHSSLPSGCHLGVGAGSAVTVRCVPGSWPQEGQGVVGEWWGTLRACSPQRVWAARPRVREWALSDGRGHLSPARPARPPCNPPAPLCPPHDPHAPAPTKPGTTLMPAPPPAPLFLFDTKAP